MERKGCSNCYWFPKCDHGSRCEYYDPVVTEGKSVEDEYRDSLRERAAIARELEEEMGDW